MSIRGAIESLYTGRCEVTVFEDYEEKYITKHREKVICTDVPCRLSYGKSLTQSPTAGDGVVPAIRQTITLFINPDINIPAGSLIKVTQNGRTEKYCMSGNPKMYSTHQEIALEIKEEYA